MRLPFGPALCAVLLFCAAPTPASAETAERFPAIALGLSIPDGSRLAAESEIRTRGRSVMVDAASARLFMIEDGRVVDSMRVIVGKPGSQTPTLKSDLHYATLNPYWNVPTDLAQSLIAPRVLDQGLSYLEERGYQVVSGFTADAAVVPAESIDWQAVADGVAQVHLRQLPGPGNSMGQVKFALASGGGIYLHDTPNKELFDQDRRNLSNGCVRLEDAPRFARWLLGRDLESSVAPEQHVRLPRSVPITITHLNASEHQLLAALR